MYRKAGTLGSEGRSIRLPHAQMQILLYVLFILSGAAGLIYESVWSRYLSLFVGHSAYAQIIVLTIFLGGMSLGALLVGRWSKRVAEPLAWYSYVEMAAGLMGLAFHGVFAFVTKFSYDSIFPALADTPFLIVAKWLIAAVLILPQSILLGTTFPLMSAGVIRIVRREPGRVLSLLYFSNSLGAACGVLVAGFVLVEMAGLPGTLAAAAIVNIVVGVSALGVVRYVVPNAVEREDRRAAEELAARNGAVVATGAPGNAATAFANLSVSDTDADDGGDVAGAEAERLVTRAASEQRSDTLWRLLLAVSFGTAVASFIYEIAWIRMLSLVLGSATHSFELMLSAFILGLALGAFWVRKRADRFADPIAALGNVQWIMGAAALATLPVYLASFGWTASLMSAVDRNEAAYSMFTFVRYGMCLAVMLPSTFMAGITLPLITRTLFTSERGESAIGQVYGVNTLGSIVGVALAGLVLMPLLGMKYLLIFGAAVDMVLGVMLLSFNGRRFDFAQPRAFAAAALMLFAVVLGAVSTKFDTSILSSGVFRTGSVPLAGSRNIVFYKDGRTASVSVSRHLSDSLVVISTNGKPDASLDAPWFRARDAGPMKREPLGSDVSTQLLLPLITLAHMPHAKNAAVIGHGSGMSSHFLLGSSELQNLYTIEIEPAMIEGSKEFMPANRRVFDDPRSHHIVDDAKSYFAATNARFDLILSEPSNPWVSGVSGLFTAEFYRKIRGYLSPDGVFGQWLHLYEINDGLVLSVLAALHQSFPAYEIFQTSSGDILIVAGLKDSLPAPAWKVFQSPAISDDLAHAVPFDSLTLEATRVLSREVLAPLLDEWDEPNSDYYPVLDLGTERTRFMRQVAGGFSSMWTQGFNVAASLTERRAGPGDDRLAVMPGLGAIFSRALSARQRKGGPVSDEDDGKFPGLKEFHYREWEFNNTLASATPPTDWHRWAVTLIEIEEDLHSGTSGFIDSNLYGKVERFLKKHDAPQELVQSVRFLRGVAEWDYKSVVEASDSILKIAGFYPSMLATDFFRDAGTVARLKLRDVDGAREFYNKLVTYGSREPTHFQSRLLDAHLIAAERKRLEGLVVPADRKGGGGGG